MLLSWQRMLWKSGRNSWPAFAKQQLMHNYYLKDVQSILLLKFLHRNPSWLVWKQLDQFAFLNHKAGFSTWGCCENSKGILHPSAVLNHALKLFPINECILDLRVKLCCEITSFLTSYTMQYSFFFSEKVITMYGFL